MSRLFASSGVVCTGLGTIRIVNGFIKHSMAALLFLTQLIYAFILITIFAPPLMLFLRPWKTNVYRRISEFIFGFWLSSIAWKIDHCNGTSFVFSGSFTPKSDSRVVIICNHRSEVDWMYLWNFAIRKNRLGDMKYFLKRALMNVPVMGWSFSAMDYIPLQRNWIKDESTIQKHLSSWQEPTDPIWLVVFPEGTDFSTTKRDASQSYAAMHNLPTLEYVLLPRSKGLHAALSELQKGGIDAVYDVTLGYDSGRPTFHDFVWGLGPRQVHMHVDRVAMDAIPSAQGGFKAWLMEAFLRKDALLHHFTTAGTFPGHRQLSGSGNWIGLLSSVAAFCTVGCVAWLLLSSRCPWLGWQMIAGAIILAVISYSSYMA